MQAGAPHTAAHDVLLKESADATGKGSGAKDREVTEQRKAQNRAAQRTYKKRQQQRVSCTGSSGSRRHAWHELVAARHLG